MDKYTRLAIAIVVMSFLVGIAVYPSMPRNMQSHWNAQGEADGYMGRFWGLFLLPVISAILVMLYKYLPKIDPLGKNVQYFSEYYSKFILIFTIFMTYVYSMMLAWNFGYRFNFVVWLSPAFALLFYYVGIMVEHARPNWFIGIRTPWTLSDDVVWEKTHKMGGKMFRIAGIIVLLGVIIPQFSFAFILIPSLFVAFYSMWYSYHEYKKRHKGRKR